MLKVALPKGKSLEERTLALFAEARIPVIQSSSTAHAIEFADYPSLSCGALLKPSRIPVLVADGDFDIGITGNDVVLESGADVEIYAELAYSRAIDSHTQGILFAHKDDSVKGVGEIPSGSVILSEYPSLTRKFFVGKQQVEVVASPGSAEAEVPRKYRFGVALSETGRSFRENGLVGLGVIFTSNTVLVANKEALADEEKQMEIHTLKLLLLGALHSRNKALIMMNVSESSLEDIVRALPSCHSPTIARLAGATHFAISSMVSKSEVNLLIPKLLKLGAKGIIIMPVSSVIQEW